VATAIFDAETRARLRSLRLRARRIRAGDEGRAAWSAQARGAFDLKDHARYAAGDDLRHLDWNLYGRLGQLFVRRYSGEADVEVVLLLDRSGSMALGNPPKHVFSRRLAAAIGFAALSAARGVQIATLGADLALHGELLRGAGADARVLDVLEALPDPGGVAHPDAARALMRPRGRFRHVVWLSDFLNESPLGGALDARASGRVEVALIVVHAQEERDPAPAAALALEGIEGEGVLRVASTPALLERYRALFEAHVEALRGAAARHGVAMGEAACESAFDEAAIRLIESGVVR
jgi:uncharacterized protein (DUF58 family)